MRTRLQNDEVGHAWFYDSDSYYEKFPHQDIGAKNLFFNGNTVYSYGSHFSIAKKFNIKGQNAKVVLFNWDSYSSTTSRHCGIVRSAIPGDVVVLDVPNPSATRKTQHKENYRGIQATLKELIETIAKGRGEVNIHRIETLNRRISQLNVYTKLFKLGYRQIPAYEYDLDKAKALKKKLTIKAKKKREKINLENASNIESWKRGNSAYIPYSVTDCFLRINPNDGEMVQTSQGASMPLSHALLLFKYVRKNKGTEVIPKQFGSFSLRSIKANGDIQIGCHKIKFLEMERLYNSLQV